MTTNTLDQARKCLRRSESIMVSTITLDIMLEHIKKDQQNLQCTNLEYESVKKKIIEDAKSIQSTLNHILNSV